MKFDGRKLTGNALTSAGRGTMVLEMTDTGVHGTLTVAGRIITIAANAMSARSLRRTPKAMAASV